MKYKLTFCVIPCLASLFIVVLVRLFISSCVFSCVQNQVYKPRQLGFSSTK